MGWTIIAPPLAIFALRMRPAIPQFRAVIPAKAGIQRGATKPAARNRA